MKPDKTLYVADRKSWHAWLAKNYNKEKEIWLIYYRKETGKPRISYNDAVEEALCYGWIDSIVKSLDKEKFAQRFSVRKKTSALSQMNKERIRKLIKQNRMTKAGLAAVSHVFDPTKDDVDSFVIPLDILEPLQANQEAWKNFRSFPESYQRIRIAYIENRKRHSAEQFEKSLANFIKMTAKNKRIGFVKEMKSILDELKGGDLRSIGKANEIAKSVLETPGLFEELFQGMSDNDPLIRMRAADIVEKVSKKRPELLQPFKSRLINEVANNPQQEVRWHAAQMFSYLSLSAEERNKVVNILFSWVEKEKSNIVKVMSLQTLADFAKQDIAIKNEVISLCNKFLVDGTPSLKSRSRKLLKELAGKAI